MRGNKGPRPPSRRVPARRSDILAGATRLAIMIPRVPTRMWRLRPFTRLYPSKPRTPPCSVVLTDWPSMMTTFGGAIAPRFQSAPSSPSDDRPYLMGETGVAAGAIRNPCAADKRWRLGQRAHRSCAAARHAAASGSSGLTCSLLQSGCGLFKHPLSALATYHSSGNWPHSRPWIDP